MGASPERRRRVRTADRSERDGDAEDQHAPLRSRLNATPEKLKAAVRKQSNQSLAQDLRQSNPGQPPPPREHAS